MSWVGIIYFAMSRYHLTQCISVRHSTTGILSWFPNAWNPSFVGPLHPTTPSSSPLRSSRLRVIDGHPLSFEIIHWIDSYDSDAWLQMSNFTNPAVPICFDFVISQVIDIWIMIDKNGCCFSIIPRLLYSGVKSIYLCLHVVCLFHFKPLFEERKMVAVQQGQLRSRSIYENVCGCQKYDGGFTNCKSCLHRVNCPGFWHEIKWTDRTPC